MSKVFDSIKFPVNWVGFQVTQNLESEARNLPQDISVDNARQELKELAQFSPEHEDDNTERFEKSVALIAHFAWNNDVTASLLEQHLRELEAEYLHEILLESFEYVVNFEQVRDEVNHSRLKSAHVWDVETVISKTFKEAWVHDITSVD